MDAPRRIATRAREAGVAPSRMSPRLLVLLLGLVGGVLLMATEFSTVASVDVAAGACDVINDANPDVADRCELSGFERHGGALVLLGALSVAMAFGAARRDSRPAAVALMAIAGVVIALTLARDLPETRETGAIGDNFEGASASAGPGFYLELGGGLMLAAGGALSLTRRR